MARNPKQDANLKKIDSTSRARELGSKGGKATAANKRAIKSFKQALVDGLTEQEQGSEVNGSIHVGFRR